MQGGAVGVVEPIAWVERQQGHLRALRQCRRLVEHEPTLAYPGRDRHASSVAPGRLPNKRLQAAAARRIMRPPRLNRVRWHTRQAAMQIASWNLNHRVGRTRFQPAAAEAAIALDVDAVFFNEYFPQQHGPAFRARLADAGWRHQLISAEPAERANRVLVASRLEVELTDVKLPRFDHQFPANVLAVRFPTVGLQVLALRVPAYKPQQRRLTELSWNWIERTATEIVSGAAIIVGDLNVPATATKGVGFETLRRIALRRWAVAPVADTPSYFSPRGTTTTLDYLLHTAGVAVRNATFVTNCSGFRLAGAAGALSDHAALVAALDFGGVGA